MRIRATRMLPPPLSRPTAPPQGIASGQSAQPSPAAAVQIARYRGEPGFWRLGRTAAGVWWFVSPENKPEFLNTVTTVQPFQNSRDPNGARFVSEDWAATPDSTALTQPALKRWANADARTLEIHRI